VPTTNGQLQLQDYDNALVARGFDGFQPAERTQLINMGYRYVARKNTSAWLQSSKTYTMAPGDPPLSVAGASVLGADDVNQVFVMTDPYRRKLRVADERVFERKWLPLDLTAASNRSPAPDFYYVFAGAIYILPPPQTTLSILVYFNSYLPDMVAVTDVPATPQIYDEVILDASLVRAHRRAHELQLAQEAQVRVDEAMMDILADDVWTMEEQQERVVPDDQWL
jgi:hypothetical protein